MIDRVLLWLLLAVPLPFMLVAAHAGPVAIFATACLALVPLAGWVGTATEHVAAHIGEGPGALLNFTLGNLAELILAFLLLRAGQYEVVKAQIAGGIMNNLLLVLGLSMFFGGRTRERQRFNATAASLGATLLTVSCVSLVLPAVFAAIPGARDHGPIMRDLSDEIAVILLVAYACNLLFSLRTHRHLYMGEPQEETDGPPWPLRRGLVVLAVCALGVTAVSEVLAGSVEQASAALGLSSAFVGVVVLATVGAAAEHATAIRMALADRMDLAVGIGMGSTIQTALFAAPLLVLAGRAMGHPMDLVFNLPEVASIVLSVLIAGQVASDGESNWMEGVQLVCVFLIMAVVFYNLP